MSIQNLGLRTQILESLDWDEEVLEAALIRAYDAVQDLIDDGVTPYEMRRAAVKTLAQEYPAKVAKDLVEYIVRESVTSQTPEA